MAKLRKIRRRKLRLNAFAFLFFSLSLLSLLACSLFVGTMNTSLTMKIQNMNNEISQLKAENAKLSIEICGLENKDRVYVIAQDAGLNQNQDNIISIQGVE
ncbi:MAG: hypothetical protein Q4B60_05195 [Erysipelotrichaceae bacterium]|nr:hypothetical protein [Erysipelotrichaceae bacterium]